MQFRAKLSVAKSSEGPAQDGMRSRSGGRRGASISPFLRTVRRRRLRSESETAGEALRASEGEDGVEARYVLGGLVAEEELHFGSFVLEVAADVPRLLVALGPPAPPLFVALSE